jgi:putative GTP pyrophosphokinase
MPERPSRGDLDRLGKRLISGDLVLADVQQLENYRKLLRKHTGRAFEIVRRHALEYEWPITQRPDKSLTSIRRKLRETTIRLGDMDDLVGCRITVDDRLSQDTLVAELTEKLPAIRWKDRRTKPSSGYRAVHGILREEGYPFELQIRTTLQDSWANLSERLSDHYRDLSIKYGGGPPSVRHFLLQLSDLIDSFEEFEMLRQIEEVQADNIDIDLTAIPDVMNYRATILSALDDSERLFR